MVSHDVAKVTALMFPARLYACQMVEPTDLISNDWDVLWDMFVPKDADVSEVAATSQIDQSRDSVDTDPFEEPGAPSPNVLMGIKRRLRSRFRPT